jgi:alpha-L-fucosidase
MLAAILAFSAAATTMSMTSPAAAQSADSRMDWWREARFGMFIHWGLYAITAGEWAEKGVSGVGEWIMYHGKVPANEYKPLANRFNPVQFSAKEWVGIAKAAGMKYIVITSKHHDGFALFNSKDSDFDVMATPFQRDILKELADECRAQGVRLCFYYSIMDWTHPAYSPRRPWDPRPELGQPDMDRYVEYMKGQLTELVTKYGDIGVLWFDGEWEDTWNHERGKDLYEFLRKLKPNLIINNRVDKGRSGMAGLTTGDHVGDFGTPEQEIPGTGLPGVDWESCMTMNDTWGFKKADHNWKSTDTLIHMLIDIASKGGNFLLNVGPTAEGLIPTPSADRLKQMGDWLRVYGESIYGTQAGPFRKRPWGGCTQKPLASGGTRLYLHMVTFPHDNLIDLANLKNKIVRAGVVGREGSIVKVDGKRLAVPNESFDATAGVLYVDIEGKPDVDNTIRQAADGTMALAAADATIHGATARYEHGNQRDNIGFWTNKDDWVSWEFQLAAPGRFKVEVISSCEPTAGGEYTLQIGATQFQVEVGRTNGWSDFRSYAIGEVRLAAAGKVTVSVKPKSVTNALMNLKSVTLIPIR